MATKNKAKEYVAQYGGYASGGTDNTKLGVTPGPANPGLDEVRYGSRHYGAQPGKPKKPP